MLKNGNTMKKVHGETTIACQSSKLWGRVHGTGTYSILTIIRDMWYFLLLSALRCTSPPDIEIGKYIPAFDI